MLYPGDSLENDREDGPCEMCGGPLRVYRATDIHPDGTPYMGGPLEVVFVSS